MGMESDGGGLELDNGISLGWGKYKLASPEEGVKDSTELNSVNIQKYFGLKYLAVQKSSIGDYVCPLVGPTKLTIRVFTTL